MGIIHGKSTLIEMGLRGTLCVIGSTNWTDSSTANVEFSAVLRHVDEEFKAAWSEEFYRGWNGSLDFARALFEADQAGYGRRSGSETVDRGRRSVSSSASMHRG